MSPEIPELRERLSDGEVELRTSTEWDIPDILIAHQDDPDLHRRLGLARPPSGAELGSAAERDPAERAAGTGVKLTIVEPGSDDCRGRVETHGIDWEQGSAELSGLGGATAEGARCGPPRAPARRRLAVRDRRSAAADG